MIVIVILINTMFFSVVIIYFFWMKLTSQISVDVFQQFHQAASFEQILVSAPVGFPQAFPGEYSYRSDRYPDTSLLCSHVQHVPLPERSESGKDSVGMWIPHSWGCLDSLLRFEQISKHDTSYAYLTKNHRMGLFRKKPGFLPWNHCVFIIFYQSNFHQPDRGWLDRDPQRFPLDEYRKL